MIFVFLDKKRRDRKYIGRRKMDMPGRREMGMTKERALWLWCKGIWGVGWCDRGKCRRQGKMETGEPM